MTSRNLAQIVNGEIKHARQQERREQYNPLRLNGKNRRVINAFPEDLVAPPATPEPDEIPLFTQPSKLELLREQIFELAKRPAYLQLLSSVLLKGKPIKAVAQAMGINYSTARTVVARTRRMLTLPIRSKDRTK
ncbi:MAG: hypothetical protein R3C17_08925 [Planctomycetaceae bacterium]